MANTRDATGEYAYHCDDTKVYMVELTLNVGTAGGFEAAESGTSPLPKRAKMRHIGLWDGTTKRRHQCPVASITDSKYTTGGSVSFNGVDMEIVGRTGEHGWRI